MSFTNGDFKNYEKNPSVVCTDLNEGGILLNLDTKYYFSLNETGLKIWQLMDEYKSPVKIAEKLVDEYAVGMEKAMKDTARLMAELEENGLILPDA